MKSKIISLAFMLVFAFSTSAFADGETGQVGGETGQVGGETGQVGYTQTSTGTSNDLLTQILNGIYPPAP